MIDFRPLTADEIEVKIKKVTDKGCVCLLYKTARTDMELLDETVGAENWYNDYKEIKGNLYAGISIRTENGWVTKWDCGIESREDEGNEKKGEASDAFKRAGFRWGIGRQLYTAPFIFIRAEWETQQGDSITLCNIREVRDAYRCNDTFIVDDIAYSEDGKRITKLKIRNTTLNVGAYSYEYKPR